MRTGVIFTLTLLLCTHIVTAVNILYDETGWTKLDWHKYKIDYSTVYDPLPSLETIQSPEIRKALAQCKLNSLDGPYKRTVEKPPPGLWSLEDGSLVQSPEDDSVDAAAEAMTCTICHGLVSHVWQQVVTAIHTGESINEATVRDMLDEACEEQHVPTKVLQKYRVVKVDAPEAGVSLFVVRTRGGGHSPTAPEPKAAAAAAGAAAADPAGVAKAHPGTDAEVAASQKSCRDLMSHHHSSTVKHIWKAAQEYFTAHKNLGRRLLSKLRLDADDVDEYEEPDTDEEDTQLEQKALQHIPEHRLLPWEALCLDLELQCPMWASSGECQHNPKYMVGTPRKLGHCRKSCGTCAADDTWQEHPIAAKELATSSSALLSTLRSSVCTSSQACMTGVGGSSTPGASAIPIKTSIVHQNAEVLPGAALAKTEGFVLGKPFWAVPEVLPHPKGGSAVGDNGDPADELLVSNGLGSQLVQIPGMDGFFIYQLHYKHRVYQFHMDSASGVVTEEHILGYYDKAATETAAVKDRLMDQAGQTQAGRAWHQQQKATQGHSNAADTADSSSASSKLRALHGEAAAAPQDRKNSGSEPGWKPTETAAAQDPALDKWSKLAPPMLELLDYLPDTISMVDSYWPYFRQLYTGGEPCGAEGKGRPRSVELRMACSPHKSMQLLIREPEFCRYVMVFYHPALCELSRYKPVPKASLGQSATAAVEHDAALGSTAMEGLDVKHKQGKGQKTKAKAKPVLGS